jgi:hypothetical protein
MISERNTDFLKQEPKFGLLMNLFKSVTHSIDQLYNSINREILEELNNIHMLYNGHLLDQGLFTKLVSRFNEYYKLNETAENESLTLKRVVCNLLGFNNCKQSKCAGKTTSDTGVLDKVARLCCDCSLAKEVGKYF